MANSLYGTGRDAFANGNIDWVNDDIRVILIDTLDYTVSIDVHDFLNDIPGAARVATSAASIAGKSTALGTVDGNDVTLSAVTGDQSEALVLYKHTGVETTSALIAYIDTVSSGLPVTPNGGDITITWDNGANKIFTL